MRYSEAHTGRVFVIRLETGDRLPDAQGKPSLHLHAALGRGDAAVAGCTRPGVDIWKVGEVVLVELLGTEARREIDPATGFSLLEP